MVHYEEKTVNFHQLISLNKSCKFCPYCELIIGQKSEIEKYLNQIILNFGLQFNPANYFVFGTMERKDWKQGQDGSLDSGKALDIMLQFKSILDFEIRPAGWYFNGE